MPMNFNFFFTINSIFIFSAIIVPISALYKLLPVDGRIPLLVPEANAKPDMVYLFQIPRSSLSPSLSAISLKTECWLRWNGVPFISLSNLFFLGSPEEGTVPFALLNNKYIYGSDNIIEVVGEHFKHLPKVMEHKIPESIKEEEKELRREIDYVFNNVLLYDRMHAEDKEVNSGGLDFIREDKSTIIQMVPVLLSKRLYFSEMDQSIDFDQSLWAEFFALLYWEGFDEVERKNKKIDFLSKHFIGEIASTSDQFASLTYELNSKFISPALNKVFKEQDQPQGEKTSSFEGKGRAMLRQAEILLKDESNIEELTTMFMQTQMERLEEEEEEEAISYQKETSDKDMVVHYADLNESQIVKELSVRLELLKEQFEKHENAKFLFGDKPTPADASLFGIMVQFFETQQNMSLLSKFFKASFSTRPYNIHVRVFYDFVERVKESLGMKEIWEKLKKSPWPMNFEVIDEQKQYGTKYKGPFRVDTTGLAAALDSKQLFAKKTEDKMVHLKEEELEKLPGEMVYVIRKIVERVNIQEMEYKNRLKKTQHWFELMREYLAEPNGIGKKISKKITKIISFKNTQPENQAEFKFIYESIMEYMEKVVVNGNVMEAIERAKRVVQMGQAEEADEAQKEAAQEAESSILMGDEH